MNSFLAVVQDNYIFTNRLAGLSVGDSVYHYDKIGKKMLLDEYKIIRTDRLNIDLNKVYTYEELPNVVMGGERVKQLTKHQGTGRITQLYKAVEVSMDNCYTPMENNYKYVIKLEKIKDIDMELNQFVSVSKLDKFNKRYPKYETIETFIEYGVGINNEQYDTGTNYNPPKEFMCKLTKYTGITRVLKIGAE
jgi:hypothetical protein